MKSNKSSTTTSPLRIVVGHRGFVWIGNVTETGDQVTITNARNIRRWGTTQGLGQLVNGPTQETKLDPVGVVRLHRFGVIATYDVNAEAWNGK